MEIAARGLALSAWLTRRSRRARPVAITLSLFVIVAACVQVGGQGALAPAGFQETSCQWLDTLPRDLSSHEDSNLDRYGGHQDSADRGGGLDLHGMQFRVPEPGARGTRILTTSIKVLGPSVLKIKCASTEPGVTCETRVSPEGKEAGDSENMKQLHVVGVDVGTVLLPTIQPVLGIGGQRFVLRLVFSVAETKKRCLPFEFMLQMRPAQSVQDETRCKYPLPIIALPPRKLKLGADSGVLHFASEKLFITPSGLQEYSTTDGSFAYPISIHVEGRGATITAQASFDWILGDLHLELARISEDDLAGSRGHVLFRSNQTETEDENAQFERSANLWATVPAGKYRLTIRDKTTTHLQAGIASASAPRVEGDEDNEHGHKMCVPFTFNLDAVRSRARVIREGLGEGVKNEESAVQLGKKEEGLVELSSAVLVSVEPATAHNLDPVQPMRLVLSFSAPLARFGKNGDGTADAGRGGQTGADEVHCSDGGGSQSWIGSALCSTLFSLRPSSLDLQRGPLGALSSRSNGPTRAALKPSTVYLRGASATSAAAQVVVTWSAASLVEGVEYVLHIEQDYLKSAVGTRVSVRAHTGRVHSYRAAACNCHGHGRCDVERRCACAVGYAGHDCQRCSEGHRLSDEGVCQVVKATVVCSRNSCNGHGSVSSSCSVIMFILKALIA